MDFEGDEGLLYTRPRRSFWSRNTKVILFVSGLLVIIALAIIIPIVVFSSKDNGEEEGVKSMIFMIGDGFGPASETLARTCANKTELPLDGLLVGTARTKSSSSYITDSAAGATAYSCAMKTFNLGVAVDPNGTSCGTLLEAAKAKGMATGLVVTSRLSHATPASFSSHSVNRNFEEFIAKQQIDLQVDVMFGGGMRIFGDLLDYAAKEKGYKVVTTVDGFKDVTSTPVLGVFAPEHMDFEIDRDPKEQPSLKEMTIKALNLLKDHPKGFFLLVEGSRIDMAGHNNDAAGQHHDTIAYIDTIETVKEFVKENPKSLMISTADHETGGLSLGRNRQDGKYPIYEWFPHILNRCRMSTEKMAELLHSGHDISLVEEMTSLNLTDDEETRIQNALSQWEKDPELTKRVIGDIIAIHAQIGWSTWGHSAVDVNVYAYGNGADGLRGNMDNTFLGEYTAEFLQLDLEAATNRVKDFNPKPPSHLRTACVTDHCDM